MYKFYWNNKNSSATGGGGVLNGSTNTSAVERGNKNQSQNATSKGETCESQLVKEMNVSSAPQIPVRNQAGVLVKVKSEEHGQSGSQQQSQHQPCGSHRVLLKLRKMSAGGHGRVDRPKSVPDSNELDPSGSHLAHLAALDYNKKKKEKHESKLNNNRRMRGSKSMQQFCYSKTWNEKTLSRCLNEEGQHNYENIYNQDKDDFYDDDDDDGFGCKSGPPPYENIRFRSLVNSSLNLTDNNNSLVISQLTQSPRSARSRTKQSQGDSEVTAVASADRKGRKGSKNVNKAAIFRSKSCERPKMRDAVREAIRIPDKFQSNFNRFSSNLADRVWNKFANNGNHHQQSQMTHSMTSHTLMQVSNNIGEDASQLNEDNSDYYFMDKSHSEDQPQKPVAFLGQPNSLIMRAIPCVDVFQNSKSQVHNNNCSSEFDDTISATSFTNSFDGEKQSIHSGTSNGTHLQQSSLAHKMKEIKSDVQKKISRLRSRSAERISQRSSVTGRSPDRGSGHSNGSALVTPVSSHVNRGHILPTPPSTHAPVVNYDGPFLGKARALVDCTPSPYDRDALRFERGDVIEIISMNQSGLWRGKCQNKIGNFKFINVEILPNKLSNREKSAKFHQQKPSSNRPKTVEELLKRNGLEEYLSVFVLNGYEDLESFQDMDEAELDYLGITDERHRTKLMTAVELLQDYAALHSGEDSGPDDLSSPRSSSSSSTNSASTKPRNLRSFRRLSFPRDSGCYASNENLPHRSSPAASDRSSHSGVSSHPESGISLQDQAGGRLNSLSGTGSSDEDTTITSGSSSPIKRSAEQAAKTRSLRDKLTVNLEELEKETSAMLQKPDNSHSTIFNNQRDEGDTKFDALVEKYSNKSISTYRCLGVDATRQKYESQFKSARSVFEQNKHDNNMKKSSPKRGTNVSKPLTATSVD